MIQNILFDFDGVILDSMPVRDYGFEHIFRSFDATDIDKLLVYHNKNGGLSRFVKIRYFFEEILHKSVSEETILQYAEDFSVIMKKELIKKKYLIQSSVDFIANNYEFYNLHIVSGSEHTELNFLCKELGISQYFLDINGSPIHKNELVKNVMKERAYKNNETILIGDSINDYEAAVKNSINFYGFNNRTLESISSHYLKDYILLDKRKNI
jgi:phosphoglycolate phosphatase-like HAD superfamily hydrolase